MSSGEALPSEDEVLVAAQATAVFGEIAYLDYVFPKLANADRTVVLEAQRFVVSGGSAQTLRVGE